MADKVFIDSNIWLYLFLQDETNKSKIAEEYISKNANNSIHISYQVINEVSNQLVRNDFKEDIIRESIEYMFKICTVCNFSKEIILSASSLREKYSFSYWDSIIIASAASSGCDILATEDMSDELKIGRMVIKNIFKQ